MRDNHELGALLRSMNLAPRRNGSGYLCRCPAHDDRSPSLSIRVAENGRLLAYCHAGCDFRLIVHALGIRGAPVQADRAKERVPAEPHADPCVLSEWGQIRSACDPVQVEQRERKLGIPAGGLFSIGVAWSYNHEALAAPMFWPGNGVIGVRLRYDEGNKGAILGSHNGLFVPGEAFGSAHLYIVEGMTDTAAFAGLKLDVAGRPSATGALAATVRYATTHANGRAVVIVPDRDDAGLQGATKLAHAARDAGLLVRMMPPPRKHKDAREWVASGATREVVEFMAANRTAWSPQ